MVGYSYIYGGLFNYMGGSEVSSIKEIIGMENKGSFGRVHVVLDDGTEAVVYVGGSCEVYYHKGIIKAFVKKDTGAH